MTEEKKTAPRNRTLTLDEREAEDLRRRLVTLPELQQGCNCVNKTVNADTLAVLPLLPDEFADLIIIDPPYNLSKAFGNNKFAAMADSNYTAYLMSWLPKVVDKLKPTGSLYICGDWRSTASLQQALSQQLHIINRITWQREKGRGASKNWKNCMYVRSGKN